MSDNSDDSRGGDNRRRFVVKMDVGSRYSPSSSSTSKRKRKVVKYDSHNKSDSEDSEDKYRSSSSKKSRRDRDRDGDRRDRDRDRRKGDREKSRDNNGKGDRDRYKDRGSKADRDDRVGRSRDRERRREKESRSSRDKDRDRRDRDRSKDSKRKYNDKRQDNGKKAVAKSYDKREHGEHDRNGNGNSNSNSNHNHNNGNGSSNSNSKKAWLKDLLAEKIKKERTEHSKMRASREGMSDDDHEEGEVLSSGESGDESSERDRGRETGRSSPAQPSPPSSSSSSSATRKSNKEFYSPDSSRREARSSSSAAASSSSRHKSQREREGEKGKGKGKGKGKEGQSDGRVPMDDSRDKGVGGGDNDDDQSSSGFSDSDSDYGMEEEITRKQKKQQQKEKKEQKQKQKQKPDQPSKSTEELEAEEREKKKQEAISDEARRAALYVSAMQGCRSVDCYSRLNTIDEGTYGVVHRAKDKETGEVVALKKIKLEKTYNGFPIIALREINILLALKHPNIVELKEIVVGRNKLAQIYMVMEYMDHDLKMFLKMMKQPFRQSEAKCLLRQLLLAVDCMHENWILHRDLKTSNLLINNRGILKICDFGLARRYGQPVGKYTKLVVTLWYRAPELLLGTDQYSTAVDMWSVGCIFAEILTKDPFLPGKGEFDQLNKMFALLGTPSEENWPGFSKLDQAKNFRWKKQPSKLRAHFPVSSYTAGGFYLGDAGFDLLSRMLAYDPEQRISAKEALQHEYFREAPLPQHTDMMPSYPSLNEGKGRRHAFKKKANLEANGVVVEDPLGKKKALGGFFLA